MHRFRHAVVAGRLAAALVLPASGVASTAHVAAASTADVSLAIYRGNCFALRGNPIYQLAKPARASGTQARALPAYSDSTVGVSLESLQSGKLAIAATRNGDLKGLLACGEINADPLPDGTVAVGLREQSGSLYAGIALLTAQGKQTRVQAYVGAGLAQGGSAEANSGVPVDATVNVTVDDDQIAADQTNFKVGSTVEFVVTNTGKDAHEVMIEPDGANEEPLTDANGRQAETEDIAPDEVSTFVFTFGTPGDFQFADHIGDDSQVLSITVAP